LSVVSLTPVDSVRRVQPIHLDFVVEMPYVTDNGLILLAPEKQTDNCKEIFALLFHYLNLELPQDVCEEIEASWTLIKKIRV
jgi:hypothetical protein